MIVNYLHLLKEFLKQGFYFSYVNIFDAMHKIYREEGWKTLYRGFNSALVGNIPYSGTAFLTFESLKAARLSKVFVN